MSEKPINDLHLERELAAPTLFPAHGRLEAHAENDIVHNIATGPFNRELVQLYIDRGRAFFDSVAHLGKFGVLTEFKESTMMTLDAWEAFADYLREVAPRNRAAAVNAHVADLSIEDRLIMSYRYTELYGSLGIPYRLFEDVPSAMAWLRSTLDAIKAAK